MRCKEVRRRRSYSLRSREEDGVTQSPPLDGTWPVSGSAQVYPPLMGHVGSSKLTSDQLSQAHISHTKWRFPRQHSTQRDGRAK